MKRKPRTASASRAAVSSWASSPARRTPRTSASRCGSTWRTAARWTLYTESGKLLKTAYYRRYQKIFGVERPTETVIIDGLESDWVTVMRYSDWVKRDVPEAWLQRDYLPRFRPE